MIDRLSLLKPIRNDFVHIPSSLRIKRSSSASFDKKSFALFLSLYSEVEDFLIAAILSSFRASITDKESFIKQRERKGIRGRVSNLFVSSDFYRNSSWVF